MLRRDYLERMIEEMGEVVGAVLGLRQQNKQTEALWILDDQFKRQFRLNSQLLNSLSIKDVIDMFRVGDTVEADKLQSLALLMKEEGIIYLEMDQPEEGMKRFMKALHLFVYASLHGADTNMWNIDQEVTLVQQFIKGYRPPVETEKLLMQYEEQVGRLDKAEDLLYRLRKDAEIGPEETQAFYNRLLKLNDEQLESGGLPREEVLEGLKAVSSSV